MDDICYNRSTAHPDIRSPDLTSENISQFQWSPDGKTFSVARVHDTSDVVMLSEK